VSVLTAIALNRLYEGSQLTIWDTWLLLASRPFELAIKPFLYTTKLVVISKFSC
jgi:hypothetical protein